MTLYITITILFTCSLAIAYLGRFYPRMQETIAITVGALFISILFLILGRFGMLDLHLVAKFAANTVNFQHLLLDAALGFLLFAGSINIDLKQLEKQRYEIAGLVLVGILISTVLIAFGIFYGAQLIGITLPFIYCCLFGALISPTDPIAVVAIIRKLGAPDELRMQIEGESLFNDGVGLVVFVTIGLIAYGDHDPTILEVSKLFLHEVAGGIMCGLIIGYLFHYLISSTDQCNLELMLTMLIPSAGYLITQHLDFSGPLAMVISGIIIGNKTVKTGFSEDAVHTLKAFWHLIEELLNNLVFMLIGLILAVIHLQLDYLYLAIIALAVVLASRFISVFIPFSIFSMRRTYMRGTIPILTWGGLRGGLALALALSIPPYTDEITGINVTDAIIVMTYVVVLFSIVVQGSTIAPLVHRYSASPNKQS